MPRVIIKNGLLLIAFLALFFVFSSENVSAANFGGLKVKTKLIYPNGSGVWLNNATATVTSTTNSTYWGRCGTGIWANKACSTAGIVKLIAGSTDECHSTVTMKSGHNGRAGEIYFGTGTNSTTTRPDTGGYAFSSCNCAFKIKLSAPSAPSGYVYDGNWHVWSGGKWVDLGSGNTHTTPKWGNDSEYQPIYRIKVKKDTPPDFLTATINCNPNKLDDMVCGVTKSSTCTITAVHPSNPSHTISYKFDKNLNGSLSDESWQSSDNYTFTFWYEDYKNQLSGGSHAVTVRGQAKCSGGLQTGTLTTNITLNRGDHEVRCDRLDAMPLFGQIPLTVDFTAHLWDNHTCTNVASATYEWNFDSPNEPTTYERTTTSNKTNYTYTKSGIFKAWFRGTVAGVTSAGCPVSSDINTEKWTESQYQEIAP